jgi:succinoglycan biosynthesis transport protein ExoP
MPPVRPESAPVEEKASTATPPTGESPAEHQLTEAWQTILKRKWLILAFALMGTAYGFYKGSTQPRLYDASSTIELHSGSANEYRIGSSSAGGEGSTSRISTQLAILRSDSLLLTVARNLNLANDPDFMDGGKPGAPFRNIDDPVIRLIVVGSLQASIGVQAIPKTDLLQISCTQSSARLAAEIPNRLVHDYIQRSFQSRNDASKRVTDFYSDQLGSLKQEVETSQARLIDLQKQLGALGFDPSLNEYTSALTDLNRAVDASELARINAEIHYDSVVATGGNLGSSQPFPSPSVPATGAPSNSASTTPGPTDTPSTPTTSITSGNAVVGLRNQIDTDRISLAQLTAPGGLGPNHPKVLALKEEIAELQTQMIEAQKRNITEAKQGYVAARSGEEHTRAALESEKGEAFKLRDKLVEFTLRQREFEANRTLYEGLQTRLRTAAVQAGLESTEIDIVDPAVPPLGPSLRPRSSFLTMNTFAMLLLGVIVAFVLEALDTSLRSVSQVEAVTGLPTLALVPRTRRAPDHDSQSVVMQNVVALSSPKSQFAESFRALRTSLLLSVAGHQPRTILLSSSTPAEGKTTVSINLACILAQSNVRVLLIDADLRRPTIHHRLGLQGRVGLTSVLTGSTTFEEAVQKLADVPTLDVLVSGPVPPFPTEMLSSETMHALLERCRGIYTHIIIDSPPLLSVTDSVVLAQEADAVVMVVRYGKSTKTTVRRARDLLARANAGIAGIVLNAIDLTSPEYRTYHGDYSYGGYASHGNTPVDWRTRSSSFLADQETGPKGGRS